MRATILCLFFFVVVTTVLGGEPAEEEQVRPAGDEQELERNEIGVFVGITAGGDSEGGGKEDTTGTIGVEYERRPSRLIGIGVLFEFAGAARRDHVGVVPLSFHAGRHARIILGAGWERSSGGEIFAGDVKLLARLGFSYRFQLVPGNSISPEINVDFVDGEQLIVAGAVIAWGF